MTTCDIDFENNPEQVVYSGQELRGTVRLKLTNFNHIRNIFIQFHGAAYTKWMEGTRKHARQENYLDRKIYLLENEDGTVLKCHKLVNKFNFSNTSLLLIIEIFIVS